MKIIILSGIFPPDPGGPATYVPLVAEGFVRRGHEVAVITLSDTLDHNDSAYCFKVIRIKRHGMPIIIRSLITIHKTLVEARTADVIFTQWPDVVTMACKLLAGKPLVMKVVGDIAWERARSYGWTKDDFSIFQNKRYGIRIEFLKWLRTLSVRNAHYAIVTTRYFKSVVSKWLKSEKNLRIVHNSVFTTEYSTNPPNIPLKTKIKIITVSRLVNHKGIDDIIAVVSQMPDVGLVVVGDGPEKSTFSTLAQTLGCFDRVHFAGYVSNKAVRSYLRDCDVFVLATTWESFGIVLLEAMAACIPVVSTDIDGVREIVSNGQNGLLVRVADRTALKNAIESLINNDLLKKKFVAASQITLEKFSPEIMIDNTLDILREAVESRAGIN